jgi:iron complex outermembrane receptor protein
MKKIITTCLALFVLLNMAQAQSTIKGIIKDIQNNQPIPGAAVYIPHTTTGCTTNAEGMFTLESKTSIDSIAVKALGYQKKSIPVKDKGRYLTITLEPSNTSLNEVQVVGLASDRKIIGTPGSVDLMTMKDLQRNDGIFLQNTLNLLPGIQMEMRSQDQGARIVIRGYGNSTNFNGVGYKAYLNGIPLTDADGTTIMDDVDFSSLGSVEVVKGPSSSLYGSGIGGVLNMTSQKASFGTTIGQDFTAGSYGLSRTNTSVGIGTDKVNLFINYGHQEYGGYRVHEHSDKDYLTMNGDIYAGEKRTVSIFTSYSNSYSLLPGELDSANFRNHPTMADPAYLANNAYVRMETSRMGVSQTYRFNSLFSNQTSVFTSSTAIEQPTAVGLTETNKSKLGARTQFVFTPTIGKMKTKWILGGEYEKNNIFTESYGLTNTILGPLKSALQVRPMMYNAFAQGELNITPSTLLTAGASLNVVEYGVSDMIAASATHVSGSGDKVFTPFLTPRVALNQILNDKVSVYISASEGYSAPATSQVVIAQTGVVNKGLQPEIGTSYEIGTKGSLLSRRLNYQLALFSMDVTNKLVSENYAASGTTPAYTATVNAGDVKYQGAEFSASYNYVKDSAATISLVRPFVSYTYSNFYNVSFKSDNNDNSHTIDYSNKKVSGVAPNMFNAGIDLETKWGLYLNTTYQYVDRMPLDFINKHYADAYGLWNAKIGFRTHLAKRISLNIFGGVNNILSANYSSLLFLNWNPATDPASFLPMAKINYYGGVSLKFMLK